MTLTIEEAIARILEATRVGALADTVDTTKTGDPGQPLRGIVTTFLATGAVIERAAELGANLVITHEPTFYGHLDTTDWLQDDAVYRRKRDLIDAHGIVVWRFHDYWHTVQPDGIITGMLQQLGWPAEEPIAYPYVVTLPPISLAVLADQLATQLGAGAVRVAGDDTLVCRRVGLLVGAVGGATQIAVLQRDDVDAVICGEINEWETCEYVRDAAYFGRPKGLIVLGHAASEEGGMVYLAEWLRPLLPDVPITHVPAGEPLRLVARAAPA